MSRDLAADVGPDSSGLVRSDAFEGNEAVYVDQRQLGRGVGEEEGLVAGIETDERGEEGQGDGGQVHNVMGECFGRG